MLVSFFLLSFHVVFWTPLLATACISSLLAFLNNYRSLCSSLLLHHIIHETPQFGAPPHFLLTMTIASHASTTRHSDRESAPRAHTRKLPSNAAAAPRKRRKRTVVSGATEDCFTCAKHGTSCDRRRPYCSQCLDQGQECSGYKTALTWGVGVASRGKLRGLSLPVTGAQPASTPSKWCQGASSRESRQGSSSTSFSASSTMAPDAKPPGSTGPSFIPHQQPSPSLDTGRSVHVAWMNSSLPPGPEVWPNTPASFSSSPSQFDSRESLAPNTPPFTSIGSEQQFLMTGTWTGSSVPPTTIPVQWSSNCQESEVHDGSLWASYPPPSYSQLLLARSPGRTPRLRYLISYYAEVIAPMIVAFDSPSNPFRTHILCLAQDSDPLQEAIATLSTSNLRQRQERKTTSTERTPASRLSCMAHRALVQEDLGGLAALDLAREEQHHRGRAVKALNAELANPHRRLADSVLATLLIVCFFHVCDTGVAQFKTQFAGVTKLLALRMRTSKCMTDDLKWFVRMFTWLDTMTAMTNDRESHLRGTCLDITSRSDGDWDLENLVGCDASLFLLVAQLGRLNLLSQHQTPRAPAPPEMFAPTAALPPSMLYPPQGLFVMPGDFQVPGAVDLYGRPIAPNEPSSRPTSPAFWTEWFSLRQKLEAWRYVPRGGPTPGTAAMSAPSAYISPPSSPLSHSVATPERYEEIFHVSESFRHAAILYSERLAYPDVSSSHPRIQNIVRIALHHVTAVQSDVYLLWPLFIAGSECVLESDRSLIRHRCRDISRDSGFCNNLSCLELLEKIWARNATTDGFGNWTAPCEDMLFEKGFRWHRAMRDRGVDGEYMVV